VIFSCVYAQFNPPSLHKPLHKPSPFTNNAPNYNPSFVSNKYTPPQTIGGGMMSQGGIFEKNIQPPSPVIQSIIDIATMTARGKKN